MSRELTFITGHAAVSENGGVRPGLEGILLSLNPEGRKPSMQCLF